MKPEYEPKTVGQALGYLIEECGEAIAAAGKSIRGSPRHSRQAGEPEVAPPTGAIAMPYETPNGGRILSEATNARVLKLLETGLSQEAIARELGIARSTVGLRASGNGYRAYRLNKEIPVAPEAALWARVIDYAIQEQDWEWFSSGDFAWVTGMLGADAEKVKAGIRAQGCPV